MFCPKCGKETTENAVFCAGCGASITNTQPTKKTNWSSTAGTIDIIDGLIMVLLTPVYIRAALSPDDLGGSALSYWVIMTVLAVFGVLAIVGGIYALRKKGWRWALAGAIAAILPFFILGAVSLVLTVMARDEFEDKSASR